jgi:hypothetical protein
MLYYPKKALSNIIDPERIFYGEGRGESGICLHLPMLNYTVGAAASEDYLLMLTVANTLIEFLLYKRLRKGPELWDYDTDAAGELFTVCGDNPTGSGIVIFDKNYPGGPKLNVFLDKTFGANEIAVRWKSGHCGDETLLKDFEDWLKENLVNGSLVASEY